MRCLYRQLSLGPYRRAAHPSPIAQSSMKNNVLVFPCGSEIGLEIHRSVQYSTQFQLIGGSSVDDHGRFAFKTYVGGLPFCDDDRFPDAINDVIRDSAIDLLMPAHDDALLALARLAAQGGLGCRLVTSPLPTCELTRSKRATYLRFRDIIRTPHVHESPDAARYPVFLKPDVGQGSKGTFLATSSDEAKVHLARDPSLLLLEYLPGNEFTVDCFTDRTGQLLYSAGRIRARISSGISVSSRGVTDDRFRKIAEKINSAIELRGAWFFQVKETGDGELALLEVAPRIAGTMGLSRARGVNLPLLSLFDALDRPVQLEENDYEVVVDRSLQSRFEHNIQYERVYLDFDDTVVLEGRINPSVMAFIYQCRNDGIKIHLITRHRNDLTETLKMLRLEGVFDELIWLRADENKADHIVPEKAIFVDDSWAERHKVAEAHKIPVFDTHMLEVLMDV